MKNPYASRWTTFAKGEDPAEKAAIFVEAAEAEAVETVECECGETAYYRPGVGAHQCPVCRKILVTRVVDNKWIEDWC